MTERIFKLQPNRTMALRGFDDLGASAALHSATADSFKVSGVFRDTADFAVLILYDADNFYEHPRLKYLPDFRFDGLTLSFDVSYTGLMPLDSPKYATIDWPYLDYSLADGTSGRLALFPHATITVAITPARKPASPWSRTMPKNSTVSHSGISTSRTITLFRSRTAHWLSPRKE